MSNITTCQICGRPIKSASGLIAHHGYKRPGNGWQTKSCTGARHLPYEVSRDLIPVVVRQIQEWKDATEAHISEWLTAPPSELLYSPKRGWKHELLKIAKPNDFKVDGHRSYRFDAYDTVFHQRIYEMKTGAEAAQWQIEFLNDRFNNWRKVE